MKSSVELALQHSLATLSTTFDTSDEDGDEAGFSDLVANLEHINNCLFICDEILGGKWNVIPNAQDNGNPFADADEDVRLSIIRGLLRICSAECSLREDGNERSEYLPQRIPKGSVHNVLLLGKQTSQAALRMLVNLTNGNSSWSSLFYLIKPNHPTPPLQIVLLLLQWSYREYLPITEEDKNLPNDSESCAKALDRFCLALGLLTNVVREEVQARKVIRRLSESLNCLARPAK